MDSNATQAAIRAGYSKRSAGKIASQLTDKTRVAVAIEKARADQAERLQITSDDVMQEIAKIAFISFEEAGATRAWRVELQALAGLCPYFDLGNPRPKRVEVTTRDYSD